MAKEKDVKQLALGDVFHQVEVPAARATAEELRQSVWFLPGKGRERLGDSLAHIKAFAEKLHDQVLQMNSGAFEDEPRKMLRMVVKINLSQLLKRLRNYQIGVTVLGRPLRSKDIRDIRDLEQLSEKINHILLISDQ